MSRLGLMIYYGAAVMWITFGLIAAGCFNKSLDNGFRWNTRATCEHQAAVDQSFSLMLTLGGPVAFVVAMALTGFGDRGWDLSRHVCEGYQ